MLKTRAVVSGVRLSSAAAPRGLRLRALAESGMIRGAAHFRRYPRNEGARGPLMRKSVFEQPIAFAVRARDLFVSSNKLRAELIVPAVKVPFL